VRALLSFAVRGRTNAVATVSLLAAASLLMPLLNYLSSAFIALTTLRRGPVEGLVVLAGAFALTGLLALLVLQALAPAAVMVLVTWAPVWVLGEALRLTASQGAALGVGAVLAVVAIGAFHVVLEDPTAWWRDLLDRLIVRGVEAGGAEQETLARLNELLDLVAPLMGGFMAGGTLLGAVLALLLARWFHAVLDNPGGFAREFRELKLDRRIAYAAVAAGLVASFASGELAHFGFELLIVAMVLYFFQGLALVHGIVSRAGASFGWLVGLYVLMALMLPQMMLLMAVFGFADAWFNFRRRWGSPAPRE